MARTRIALFEGYGTPFRGAKRPVRGSSSTRTEVRSPTSTSLGALSRSFSGTFGRRAYYVPPRNESMTDSRNPYRKGYKVKAKRATPAMKRAQKKFKTCARKCATRRGAHTKFPSCMRKCVRKKSKR